MRRGRDHFILLEMGARTPRSSISGRAGCSIFSTNDRCAAGTGRYLENMARFLKMPLTEFAGGWQVPVEISQTCAIFGETELVGYLLEGVEPPGSPPGRRLGWPAGPGDGAPLPLPRPVFVGGVAKNRAVVKLLGDQGDFQVRVPPYPQFNGALGCALEAGRVLAGKSHEPPGRCRSPARAR